MVRIILLLLFLAALTVCAPRSPQLALVANDADSDGCSDGEELGPNQALGGRRDPEHFWDFFDAPAGVPPARNQIVNIIDIGAVVARFGATRMPPPTKDEALAEALAAPAAPPAYHAASDRGGPEPEADLWDLLPPNGNINIVDIGSAVVQFGHTCLGPEVAGTWSDGSPMPTPRTEVTSALLDGVIYVIGGFPASGGNTDLVEAYDTAADSWSTKAPMPQRLDHAGAAAVGGKIYVVGGYKNLFQGTLSSATYEYDPAGNTWTARATMPLARAAAATVVVNGLIYVLGGIGPQSTLPLAYDPAANSWSQLAPMSAAREHLTASAVGGEIYVAGGRQNVTQNVNALTVYDPGSNTWETLTPMPTARGGLASGVLAGRVHVVGGEDLSPGGSTFPQHEVYEPASDSWQPGPPLPTPRHGLTAQVVNGNLYVIGGGPTPRLSVSDAVEIFELKP